MPILDKLTTVYRLLFTFLLFPPVFSTGAMRLFAFSILSLGVLVPLLVVSEVSSEESFTSYPADVSTPWDWAISSDFSFEVNL